MQIQQFSTDRQDYILGAIVQKHAQLAQLHLSPSARSLTARNYDSSIKSLGGYMQVSGSILPTKGVLSAWRDQMIADGYQVNTVRAKLSAVRRLLQEVADDVPNLEIKMALNDWAKVESPKETVVQDKLEEDYGRRLTLESVQQLFNSIPSYHIKGLRDRAIISLGVGAGLRVSEIVALTMKDVFLTANRNGERGIRVRKGKHNKSRVVVIGEWTAWVYGAVAAYTDVIGLDPEQHADQRIIRGVKPYGKIYATAGDRLSSRNAQAIFEGANGYLAEYDSQMVQINMHDLRRTYAMLCRRAGMSWDALRLNMGHNSVQTTERYVGTDVDWQERIPDWSIVL